jgi:hypothetical protein
VSQIPASPAQLKPSSARRDIQVSPAALLVQTATSTEFPKYYCLLHVVAARVYVFDSTQTPACRVAVDDGALHVLAQSSSSSSLLFSIGGNMDRTEAALSQMGGLRAAANDRYFAVQNDREEFGIAGGSLAVLQGAEGGSKDAGRRLQVWGVGGGGLLFEVGSEAEQAQMVCWEAFLGRGKDEKSDELCWLMCASSRGDVAYTDMSAAAAAAAAAAAGTGAASSARVPNLIQSLELAAKLQALPGHLAPHFTPRTPQVTINASWVTRRRCASHHGGSSRRRGIG